jgi:hypothetical protein
LVKNDDVIGSAVFLDRPCRPGKVVGVHGIQATPVTLQPLSKFLGSSYEEN